MPPRFRRIGGHLYPHQVRNDEPPDDESLRMVLMHAHALEVKVYRMDPKKWRFRGGPGAVDFTTDAPELVTWPDLLGTTKEYLG